MNWNDYDLPEIEVIKNNCAYINSIGGVNGLNPTEPTSADILFLKDTHFKNKDVIALIHGRLLHYLHYMPDYKPASTYWFRRTLYDYQLGHLGDITFFMLRPDFRYDLACSGFLADYPKNSDHVYPIIFFDQDKKDVQINDIVILRATL